MFGSFSQRIWLDEASVGAQGKLSFPPSPLPLGPHLPWAAGQESWPWVLRAPELATLPPQCRGARAAGVRSAVTGISTDTALHRTGCTQFITGSRAGCHLWGHPWPHHLACMLIKGKINRPGLVAPLPVPASSWLDLSWEGLSLLLGMVAREEETHPE